MICLYSKELVSFSNSAKYKMVKSETDFRLKKTVSIAKIDKIAIKQEKKRNLTRKCISCLVHG